MEEKTNTVPISLSQEGPKPKKFLMTKPRQKKISANIHTKKLLRTKKKKIPPDDRLSTIK